MMKRIALLIAIGFCHPVWASDCPEIVDNSITKDRLHAELLQTTKEMDGRTVAGKLWMIWLKAPDQSAQSMLDKGMARIRVADYEKAIEHFSALVEYCPQYAEGWNKRAYVHFLMQDYDAGLEDITKALDIEPRHFGALAGRATILLNMGRVTLGQTALRNALKINPWLSERHLVPSSDEI